MEAVFKCTTSTATILACQKISKSFLENIYELSNVRKEWNVEYAKFLNKEINQVIEKYYDDSLNSINDEKYREWHDVMVAGLQSLKILRASLKVDFKKDKAFLKDIFRKLGYTDYFSDAKNGDHLCLYKLLTTFVKNLDEQTKQEILKKSVTESLLKRIYKTAEQIEEYKDCFEAFETEYELSSSAQKEVANIYGAIRDICRIATAYFQFEPVIKDEFNFYKVMVNL